METAQATGVISYRFRDPHSMTDMNVEGTIDQFIELARGDALIDDPAIGESATSESYVIGSNVKTTFVSATFARTRAITIPVREFPERFETWSTQLYEDGRIVCALVHQGPTLEHAIGYLESAYRYRWGVDDSLLGFTIICPLGNAGWLPNPFPDDVPAN